MPVDSLDVNDGMFETFLSDGITTVLPNTPHYSGHFSSFTMEAKDRSSYFNSFSEIFEIRETIDEMKVWFGDGYKIPDSILLFKNLKELTIYCIGSSYWPAGFSTFKKLEKLSISFDSVTPSPEIGNLTALRELTLQVGKAELPDSFTQLQQLTSLKILCSNKPSTLERVFSLKNLTMLNLNSWDDIQRLPGAIGNLTKLETLNMERNGITYLPPEIGKLTKLKHLNLWQNRLDSLPAEIGLLENLEELNLDENQLKKLPDGFGRLTKLETLNIWNNKLSALPAGIGNLSLLRTLNAADNPIQHIPKDITNLRSIEKIIIDRWQITNCSEAAWATLNKTGLKIETIPSKINGKPLSYFLTRNNIDKWSKLYVQGKLALQNDSASLSIADSVLTKNKETQLFYLHILVSAIDTSDSVHLIRDSDFSYYLYEAARNIIVQNPCLFISQVRYGKYKSYYDVWMRKVFTIGNPEEEEQMRADMRKRLKAECGNRYSKELENILNRITRYETK